MKQVLRIALICSCLALMVAGTTAAQAVQEDVPKMIAVTDQDPLRVDGRWDSGGGDRILILDPEIPWDRDEAVVWSWSAMTDPNVDPEHARTWFPYPSEVKPLDNGRLLGMTASGTQREVRGGGAALIDVRTREVVWYGLAGDNPHSIEMLPDGNVVTTSSNDSLLSLHVVDLGAPYDPYAPDRKDYELIDGHGLYWDDARQLLWALGGPVLDVYEYDSDAYELIKVESIPLPLTPESYSFRNGQRRLWPGGHDLSPVPGKDRLYITVNHHIWEFDMTSREFLEFPYTFNAPVVKSIDQVSHDGPILMLRATEGWWSNTVIQLNPLNRHLLPEANIYKARWWPYPVN